VTEQTAEKAPGPEAPPSEASAGGIPPAIPEAPQGESLGATPQAQENAPMPSAPTSEAPPLTGESHRSHPEQSRQQSHRGSQEHPQHFRHRPPPPPPPSPRKFRSLQEASEEVLAIIDRLNDALCDLEQVSKMLDEVEVQQRADDREIESLRNALRQFQNPPQPRQHPQRDRDRGQRGGHPHSHNRYRDRPPERRQNTPVESAQTQPPPESPSSPPQPQTPPENPELPL
jgi:hypothetical protein